MNATEKTASLLKDASVYLASSSVECRNSALIKAAEMLSSRISEILEANRIDVKTAETDEISAPLLKRLRMDENKLSSLVKGLKDLVSLPDPSGRTLLCRELDEGLILKRVSCPIGVIGVVFEARPEALVQIASLCIKSGNCAVLKGGREAANTNRVLFDIMKNAVTSSGLPSNSLALLETRDEISELLKCDKFVDLLIPRGSNSFVKYVMTNTNIPVMGHAAGVCHVYVDKCADIDMACKIVCDSKTQYPAACNAAETVIIHRDVAERFFERYSCVKENFPEITLVGNSEAAGVSNCKVVDEPYGIEYSDNVLAVKLVSSVEEAILHINRYGSNHTDSIVTEDDKAAELFFRLVDSAGVYRNCSTRFADGFRYGFGAEVGISTSKLHARGPVGLDGLVTYKYLISGSGQLVNDYASGKRSFTHKDIEY